MELVTKTEAFNLAVLSLGQTANIMNADTDSSLTARVLRQANTIAFNKALDITDWRCFRKTGALLLLEEKVSDSWEYRYAAPSDAHKILRVDFEDYFPNYDTRAERKLPYVMDYLGAAVSILTNVPTARCEYVARPAPGSGVPYYFAEAWALTLAEMAAPGLITNNWVKMKEAFLKDARQRISQAVATDLGAQPERRAPESSFAAARQG